MGPGRAAWACGLGVGPGRWSCAEDMGVGAWAWLVCELCCGLSRELAHGRGWAACWAVARADSARAELRGVAASPACEPP